MKKFLLVALLGVLPSCVLPGSAPDGAKGIPVEQAAGVLRALADDLERWDLNKDGLIDGSEYYGIASAVAARLLIEMQR